MDGAYGTEESPWLESLFSVIVIHLLEVLAFVAREDEE